MILERRNIFKEKEKTVKKGKRKPEKWRMGLMGKAGPRNLIQESIRIILKKIKKSGTLAWPCIFIGAEFAGSPVNLAFLFDFDSNDNVLKSSANLQKN
jgi:hypothetical protein